MWFTSDNAAGPAPEVLAAIAEAAAGPAWAYGADPLTERAEAMIRERFEAPEAAIRFVATGTASNSLALATIAQPWSAIYCHRTAHIEVDECNGPEFFTGGAKLTLVEGASGRMTPETLRAAMAAAIPGDVHHPQRGALSLTNATEMGTVYTPDQVAALTEVAHAEDMPTHLDGTRFGNAVARLGASPAEMSWKAGVDVLCFGATKNGALGAEAVVMFDPELAWEFELRRKRAGHLFSKMRFLAAQFTAMMTDDLWLKISARTNALADRLAAGLADLPDVEIMDMPEANLMFFEAPRALHAHAMAKGAAYGLMGDLEGPGEERLRARLVCANTTRDEEVDAFIAVMKG